MNISWALLMLKLERESLLRAAAGFRERKPVFKTGFALDNHYFLWKSSQTIILCNNMETSFQNQFYIKVVNGDPT